MTPIFRQTVKEFPEVGEEDKVYFSIETRQLFRWYPSEQRYNEIIMVRDTANQPPFMFEVGESVRHVKTGGMYKITHLPNQMMIESTEEPAYGYLAADGRIWVRSRVLMEDGRFEKAVAVVAPT